MQEASGRPVRHAIVDDETFAREIVARGLPLLLLYGWLFDLVLPETAGRWFAFGAALILAILVSFHWQLLVNLAAFWMVDATGLARIAFLGVLLFTGIVMPLAFFPDWLAGPARWLPFAAYVNTPAEVFLGLRVGSGLWLALGQQLAWLLILALVGRLVFRRGLQRLTAQGG